MVAETSSRRSQRVQIAWSNRTSDTTCGKDLGAGVSFRHYLIASALLVTTIAIAATQSHTATNSLQARLFRQVARPFIESRSIVRQRQRRQHEEEATTTSDTSVSSNMQSESPNKRSAALVQGQRQPKRLRGSTRRHANGDEGFGTTPSPSSSSSELLGSGAEPAVSFRAEPAIVMNGTDINNNNGRASSLSADASGDINNNTVPGGSNQENEISSSQVGVQRNVNSVNGTIDLSLYANSDVDRLYGDALLVYLKNFNETLPIRRETISINGSSVPAYRSVGRRVSRVPQ